MNKEIAIYNIPSVPQTREEITNRDSVDKLLSNINDLNNIVLNFDSLEQIKESKKLKTHANKFIKDFKLVCDPLEEEGRKIGKVRSEIKLTLEKIVVDKLQPIVEREKLLLSIKDKLFIPSLSIDSCNTKLSGLLDLEGYNWLGLEDEALPLIEQSKTFFENELIGFKQKAKEEAEALETAKQAREADIAKKAAENAIIETENRIRREQEVKKRQELEERIEKAQKLNNIEHKRQVHNGILEALSKLPCQSDGDFKLDMKFIITAIAKGEIPSLYIQY